MLNEAIAKEVARNVRRREAIGNAAGELAVSQGLKDMPIPLDSDPRRRFAMKAVTVAASNSSSQRESSRAVADESRIYVEVEERRIQKFEGTEHQTTNNDENIDGGVTNG